MSVGKRASDPARSKAPALFYESAREGMADPSRSRISGVVRPERCCFRHSSAGPPTKAAAVCSIQ